MLLPTKLLLALVVAVVSASIFLSAPCSSSCHSHRSCSSTSSCYHTALVITAAATASAGSGKAGEADFGQPHAAAADARQQPKRILAAADDVTYQARLQTYFEFLQQRAFLANPQPPLGEISVVSEPTGDLPGLRMEMAVLDSSTLREKGFRFREFFIPQNTSVDSSISLVALLYFRWDRWRSPFPEPSGQSFSSPLLGIRAYSYVADSEAPLAPLRLIFPLPTLAFEGVGAGPAGGSSGQAEATVDDHDLQVAGRSSATSEPSFREQGLEIHFGKRFTGDCTFFDSTGEADLGTAKKIAVSASAGSPPAAVEGQSVVCLSHVAGDFALTLPDDAPPPPPSPLHLPPPTAAIPLQPPKGAKPPPPPSSLSRPPPEGNDSATAFPNPSQNQSDGPPPLPASSNATSENATAQAAPATGQKSSASSSRSNGDSFGIGLGVGLAMGVFLVAVAFGCAFALWIVVRGMQKVEKEGGNGGKKDGVSSSGLEESSGRSNGWSSGNKSSKRVSPEESLERGDGVAGTTNKDGRSMKDSDVIEVLY